MHVHAFSVISPISSRALRLRLKDNKDLVPTHLDRLVIVGEIQNKS
jgi:hypothetical protein